MNKYVRRVTTSERGETFNPLIWPFLISTLSYGIGFTFFTGTTAIGESSLYQAMFHVFPALPHIWGIVALLTIVVGFTFLMFRIPPAGKVSGIVGFMLWVCASICWGLTGGVLLLFAIGIPNMYFWFWQYLSLTVFRFQDKTDKETMEDYDAGLYDDDNGGKKRREDNRGQDIQ